MAPAFDRKRIGAEAGGGHAFAFATQISRSWSPRVCPAPRRLPRGPWRGRPECWQPPGPFAFAWRAAPPTPRRAPGPPHPGLEAKDYRALGQFRSQASAPSIEVNSVLGALRSMLSVTDPDPRRLLPAGAGGAAPDSSESGQRRAPQSSNPHFFWAFDRQIDRHRLPHRKARLQWRGRAQCRVARAARFPPPIRAAAVSTVEARTRIHRLLTMARGPDHGRKHAGEVPIARKCLCGRARKNAIKTIR